MKKSLIYNLWARSIYPNTYGKYGLLAIIMNMSEPAYVIMVHRVHTGKYE